MNHPESFRLYTFVGFLFTMALWESIRPVRKWETERSRRWLFHGGVTILNTLLTRLVFLGPVLMWLSFVRDQGWGIGQILGLSGIVEIVATLIVFDAFDYWWHRFNHTIPFLWRFHQMHHMDTQVDVTTSLRFHPGELFLAYCAKAVWILVWGPSLFAFLIFEAAITAYSQFHHSNIDFSDKVERLIRIFHMTPRLHAAHHTVTIRTRDANYSTIFLIWDRLFRTLRDATPEELKRLGLPKGRDVYLSPKSYLLIPFQKQI